MTNSSNQSKNKKNHSLPLYILRILIPSKYIGSLIGKNGNHPIKEIHIASNTKCLVDKNGPFKIFPNMYVKTITFVGNIDGICNAFQLVTEFIKNNEEKSDSVEERKKSNSNNDEIFVRFPDIFIGKLIGKKGNNIKKIIDETNCYITVSSDAFIATIPPTLRQYIPEPLSNERTVIVSSDNIVNIIEGIKKISQIRHEMNINFKDNIILSRMHRYQIPYPINNIAPYDNNFSRYQRNVYQYPLFNLLPIGSGGMVQENNLLNHMKMSVFNTLKIFIPENCVGPVIGVKGSYIKFILSQSGAQVKIEPLFENNINEISKNVVKDGIKLSNEENINNENLNNKKDDALKSSNDREISITGCGPNIQYAQQLIFLKISEATSTHIDKLKLTTEIQIPHEITGKVIGKQGKNVNYLQRTTGAKVCVSEGIVNYNDGKSSFTKVRIRGTIASILSVQLRLQKIVVDNMNEKI